MDKIKQHFEAEAKEFDQIILKLVPHYTTMVQALVYALPFDKQEPIKVIDIGCGTGTIAKQVLSHFPNARLDCLDLAENMIEMAKAKLFEYPNVNYYVGNFEHFEFDNDYQAVVSSLALHHLVTDNKKIMFYQKIYDMLISGGCFYNADIVLASSAHLQDVYMREWKRFMNKNVSEEEIENTWLPKYREEDRPARLVAQLHWLQDIGFTEVDVLWKYYNFAVYGGVKTT